MQWERSLITGAALGLVVSMAPGANLALCVRLARERLRAALPLIGAAASTDCCYALLCSFGALRAVRLDRGAFAWVSAGLLVVAAFLTWPGRRSLIRSLGAGSVAALNPATGALWAGLSGTVVGGGRTGDVQPLALALGALAATASWFLAVGYLTSRLQLSTVCSDRLARTFSLLLVAAALAQAAINLAV